MSRRKQMLNFIEKNQHISMESLKQKTKKYFPKATNEEIIARINCFYLMRDLKQYKN